MGNYCHTQWLSSAYRGNPWNNVMWKARFLEAPTIVVFCLSMMVVVMVFGIYISLFGMFGHI